MAEAAQAYEAGVPRTAAALVDAASPVDSVDLNKSSGGFVTQDLDGSAVEIDKRGEVTLSAPGVSDIGVSVAGATGRSVLADGAAVRSEALPSTDVVTRATDDGVQIVAVLNDENAPDTITFPVDLPEGGRLVAQPDGGVVVQAPVQGTANGPESVFQDIAEIAPAWAVDANGDPIASRYEVEGDDLVQLISTDRKTAFPVVADPWFIPAAAAAAAATAAATWCAKGAIASVPTKALDDLIRGKKSSWKSYARNAAIGCLVGEVGSIVWKVVPGKAKELAIVLVFKIALKFRS